MKTTTAFLLAFPIFSLYSSVSAAVSNNKFSGNLKPNQLSKLSCQQINDEISASARSSDSLAFNFKDVSLFFSTPNEVCKNLSDVVSASSKIASKCAQTIRNSSENPFQSDGKDNRSFREYMA
jgi:hypothetical protein